MAMPARWMRCALLMVLAALGLGAHLPAARAQTIVVEGHVGHRPDDFARLVGPVLAALEHVPDWSSAIQVGHQFERQRSRATVHREELSALADRLRQLVSRGNDAWMDADFGRARQIYRHAMDIARDAPGDVTGGPEWKPLVQRALVGLALSAKRGDDPGMAEAAMQEFLRSYPDETVDRTTFGPEAAQLFEAVKAVATKQAPGSLVVQVDDPQAVVFVDERWAGIGGARLEKLLPGLYRVQVRKGDYSGRVYSVEVASKRVASLTVEWSFDAALVTGDWVGFVFPTLERKSADLTAYALQLGKAVGARNVVVLEESEVDGRRLLLGSVLAVETGRPVRTASMAISPVEPPAEHLSTLGRYLGGEPGVVLPAEPTTRAPPRSSPLPWIGSGVGVAAMAGGGILVYLDGRCVGGGNLRLCPDVYDTTYLGVAVASMGLLLATSSSYFLWTRRTKTAPMVAITGQGLALGVVGAF